MRKVLLLIIFSLALMGVKAEPISAVWVLPWDLVRPSSIDSVLTNLQANGQNTIMAEVRYRADAIYRPNKRVNDYANLDVRSHIMKSSEFDALAYLLSEAKKYDIEVHAWITTLVITPHDLSKLPENHIFFKHPEWITTDLAGNRMSLTSAEGYFFDPGLSLVREYTLNVINDLLLNYPQLAGLHLDYIRYPGQDYGFHPLAIEESGLDLEALSYSEKMFWKEDNLTAFLAEIYTRVKELNPNLEVSTAVVADIFKARSKYSQNWQDWLQQGIIDKLYLMAYSKDDKLIEKQLSDPFLDLYKDKIVVGLRAWDEPVNSYCKNQLKNKITISRNLGYSNLALFSYSGIMQANYWTILSELFVKTNDNKTKLTN